MKRKINIGDLFFNNKFLLVFSLIVSIAIWLFTAVEMSPEVSVTIKDVPVTMDFTKIEKNLGLKAYSETDYKVNVTIYGKRYIVNDESIAEDLVVSPNTAYVNSSGTYNLKLDCTSTSARPNYTITDISLEEVSIYFDYPKSEEFVIEPSVKWLNGSTIDGYFVDEPIIGDTNIIGVSGPETEINKIEKIVATGEIEAAPTQNITIDAVLNPITKDGSTLKYITTTMQSEQVQITYPVYKKVNMKPAVTYKNKPLSFVSEVPYKVTIEPETAMFGIQEVKAEEYGNSFVITTIDFNSLKPGKNVFTVKQQDITGGILIDDISEFTVTVNVNNATMKEYALPEKISFSGLVQGYTAEIKSLNFESVVLSGDSEELESTEKSGIELSADLSSIDFNSIKANKDKASTFEVPIIYRGVESWLCGVYTAEVEIGVK